jgi:fructose-1,6-bisphosphatase
VISDDLVQKTEGEIRANRRGTIRELHHIIPEVSKTAIHEAVTKKNYGTENCAHAGSQNVNGQPQKKQMGSARKFFTRYAQEDEFLDFIVSGDETRGFHHTPESEQQ